MCHRVLVTGSRTWVWAPDIRRALDELRYQFDDLAVVHGACPRGADAIADAWCRQYGVPVERYPADWARGRGAGLARNTVMVGSRPDRCLAFIHNGSPGASFCADLAERSGIPTYRFARSDGGLKGEG